MEQRPQQLSNKRAGKAFAPQGAPKLPLASPALAAAAAAGRKVALGSAAPAMPAPPAPQQQYAPPPSAQLAGPDEQIHIVKVHYVLNGRRFVASHPFVSPRGAAIQDIRPELQA